MAKAILPNPDAALLAGLRKALAALPESLPLRGTKGVFPTGVKGDDAARIAVERGYLTATEVLVGAGKKAKPIEHGLLTPKGVGQVLDADSPKAVLESIRPAVERLAERQGKAAPPNPRADAERAAADCVASVQRALESFRSTLGEVLAAAQAPAPDAAAVLGALGAAINRVQPLPTPLLLVPQPAQAGGIADHLSPEVLDRDIREFLGNWVREKSVGCRFDTLIGGLRHRHPNLSLGEFHDALRRLDKVGALRLGGWAGTLQDLPDPSLAFFLSHKVIYYAHAAST